jgi:hypothetical protein
MHTLSTQTPSNYLIPYMMNKRKIPSSLIAAILAGVITFSSSTLLTPVPAQSSTEQGGESGQEESDTGTDTGTDTARQDYQEFNTCLSDAEGEEGFATEDEIRECFQPIYIGGEASQDEESDDGSGDEESDDGSGDEDDSNAESNDSEN